MALCLHRKPGVEVVLLAARDQLTAGGHLPPGSPLSGLRVQAIPLPAKALHYLWRTFNWPTVERWCGSVDWVYSPTEMYVPAKNARTAATIHCVNSFEKDLPWSKTDRTRRERRQMASVFRPIIQHADLVCTVSEFLKHRITELLGADSSCIVVVGNGVEDAFFAESRQNGISDKQDSEPYVLSVGGLVSRKGAEHLIVLARYLLRAAPDLKLVVAAGRWAEPQFLPELEQLPNLLLRDYVGLDQLPRLIKGAKALLILSRYETFGIPAIEAMAVGTPVIAARFAALPEIVGEAGIFVDAAQPAEILSALVALNDVKKCERYRQFGFQRARQFTWEACASRLVHKLQRAALEGFP